MKNPVTIEEIKLGMKSTRDVAEEMIRTHGRGLSYKIAKTTADAFAGTGGDDEMIEFYDHVAELISSNCE